MNLANAPEISVTQVFAPIRNSTSMQVSNLWNTKLLMTRLTTDSLMKAVIINNQNK